MRLGNHTPCTTITTGFLKEKVRRRMRIHSRSLRDREVIGNSRFYEFLSIVSTSIILHFT